MISIDIFTTNTAKILYTSISSLPSSSYTLPNGHIIYIGQAWTIGHKIVPFLSQGQSSEIGAVEYLWHGNHLFWNVYFSNNRQECPTDRAGQHQSNNLDNHSFWVNGLKKLASSQNTELSRKWTPFTFTVELHLQAQLFALLHMSKSKLYSLTCGSSDSCSWNWWLGLIDRFDTFLCWKW